MAPSQGSETETRRIIFNLSFGAFIRDAGQYVIWVIMSVYLSDIRSLPYISIGLVFLIAGLISVPVSTMGGNLIDRIGRRKVAVIIPWTMAFISAALFFLVFTNASLLAILSLFIISGPLMSFQYVTMSTIISDVTFDTQRISAFSSLRIASNVGIGIGLVAGGLLSEFNYAYVFLLSIAGYAAEGIIYYFQIPETSPRHKSTMPETYQKPKFFIPYKDTFFVAISIIISMSWFFSGMFESTLTPLYMSSVNGFSPFSITILFALNSAIVIFFQTPLNRILRNMRDSIRIVLGLFLYAIAYALFATTGIYLIVAAAVVILTLGENFGSPASSALITKIAPEENRGAYLGFNSSIGSLVNPFRPLVGTVLLTLTVASPSISWIVLGSVTALLAMIFLAVFRTLSTRRVKLGLAHI